MADQKKIISWFIQNHEKIGLKVNKVSWPKKWWPEVSDYEVHINIDGTVSMGRGIDENSELAFTKACVEAVERHICAKNNINSNGLAYHPIKSITQANARKELIEREMIKSLYANQRALPNLSYNDVGLSELGLKLNNDKAQLLMKKVIVDELVIVLSCIVSSTTDESKELFLGFSCGNDLEKVAKKAVSESMVNFTAISNSNIQNIESVSQKSFNGFKPYYSCKNEVLEVLSYLNKEGLEENYSIETNDINFESVDICDKTFHGLDLYGYKARLTDKLEVTTRFNNEVAIV